MARKLSKGTSGRVTGCRSCSRGPRMRHSITVGLSADVNHGTGGGHEVRLADVVTSFLAIHDLVDKFNQFGIRGSPDHQLVQIVIPRGEQTSANLAIGSDADPAAVSAEGVRDRSDDPDFANTIFEKVTAGGLAPAVHDLLERKIFGHAAHDFVQGDHDLG